MLSYANVSSSEEGGARDDSPARRRGELNRASSRDGYFDGDYTVDFTRW